MQTKNKLSLELFAVFVFSSLSTVCRNAQRRVADHGGRGRNQADLARGNTHPLARPQFDRGRHPQACRWTACCSFSNAAPHNRLLSNNCCRTAGPCIAQLSQMAHARRIRPAVRPADQDIQTITSWLQSHGFQVGNVSNGRTVIEFSGTAGSGAGSSSHFDSPIRRQWRGALGEFERSVNSHRAYAGRRRR